MVFIEYKNDNRHRGGIRFMLLEKINIFADRRIEIEGVETWVVEWKRNNDNVWERYKNEYQIFTKKEEADKFANALRDAHKLLKNEVETKVLVYKSTNGL